MHMCIYMHECIYVFREKKFFYEWYNSRTKGLDRILRTTVACIHSLNPDKHSFFQLSNPVFTHESDFDASCIISQNLELGQNISCTVTLLEQSNFGA